MPVFPSGHKLMRVNKSFAAKDAKDAKEKQLKGKYKKHV